MADAAVPALLVLAAFAAGSVPWGLLVTRWVAGVDVRTVGSGNVGATNVSRVLGRGWFFVVFALDAAKGAAPVLLLPPLAGTPTAEWLRAACGLSAVLGHVFSPFLGFKGGKGVATAAGVIGALAPVPALGVLAVFLVTLFAVRFVSVASMAAAVALAPLAYLLGSSREVVVFGVIAAALVISRHKSNLARIASGTEPRVFGEKKEMPGG